MDLKWTAIERKPNRPHASQKETSKDNALWCVIAAKALTHKALNILDFFC